MTRDTATATRTEGGWITAALARHERPLTLFTARLLDGDVERARDLVQEAFLRLCERPRGEVEGREAEWLFRVCRNLAFDHRRKEARMGTLGEEEALGRAAAGPAPSEGLERRDTLEHVRERMRALPERQQEVLRLKFQHGLSYREIASVTNENPGTVGWLIHVAIKTLREELGRDELEGAQA